MRSRASAPRRSRGVPVVGALLTGACLAVLAPTSPAAPARRSRAGTSAAAERLSATVAPAEVGLGRSFSVTGALLEAGRGVGGTPLVLEVAYYPFAGYLALARTSSSPDGSFSFPALRADRDARLLVRSEAGPAASSPRLALTVDPEVALNSRSLGPGRTRLSIRIRHSVRLGSPPVSARWFLAARASDAFRLLAVTPTREISSGVTYASAIVDPPGRRFLYRVCVNPTWEAAMGPAAAHGACPGQDFTVDEHGG